MRTSSEFERIDGVLDTLPPDRRLATAATVLMSEVARAASVSGTSFDEVLRHTVLTILTTWRDVQTERRRAAN